mmetsp:Transcript_92673/g.220493  ORF Transcript_92673/g.220493 Transcript_92673/m.220493 type:complete len:205 (-) Transcript_92673:49-663(-)
MPVSHRSFGLPSSVSSAPAASTAALSFSISGSSPKLLRSKILFLFMARISLLSRMFSFLSTSTTHTFTPSPTFTLSWGLSTLPSAILEAGIMPAFSTPTSAIAILSDTKLITPCISMPGFSSAMVVGIASNTNSSSSSAPPRARRRTCEVREGRPRATKAAAWTNAASTARRSRAIGTRLLLDISLPLKATVMGAMASARAKRS